MIRFIRNWFDRHFADEEAVLLSLLLVAGFIIVLTMGTILAPVIAALIFAFLMQGLVNRLLAWGMPRWGAISLSFSLFMAGLIGSLVFLLPLVGRQLSNLVREIPLMLDTWNQVLLLLPEKYPQYFSQVQLQNLIQMAGAEVGRMGQSVLSFSVSSLPALITAMIYLVLVPILVFFFLKDGEQMRSWMGSFLPEERPVIHQVSEEMNLQIANYVRGKVIEILVVGSATLVAFSWLGLDYAVLLSLAVGLSVVIPYIGAVVITIPVILIALFQWGVSPEFWWVFGTYLVIQALDGNVLVPLLFSEAVKLHPVVIVLAVLIFGGLWGLWGVFFAIPLATLFKAVFNAWPTIGQSMEERAG